MTHKVEVPERGNVNCFVSALGNAYCGRAGDRDFEGDANGTDISS